MTGAGPSNPNWKGGRVTDPRGYVLIRVGVGHPLADVRGYAYEHRLKAEEKMGRQLQPGEEVHHADDQPGNNDPANLDPKANRAEHSFEHRSERNKYRLRLPGAPNPTIECACGCGGTLLQFDATNRPRRYLPSHNFRSQKRDARGHTTKE